MADFGLFIGFGSPVRGREAQAGRVFGEAMAHWAELQKRGEIESFEVAMLAHHGGDLWGFMLVRGTDEQLGRVQGTPEYQRLIFRAGAVIERLGVVHAHLGSAAAETVARSNAELADLMS